MRTTLRLLLLTVSVICFSFISPAAFGQATLVTDQFDYPPGSTCTITGAGFQPGETVSLQVLHYNYMPGDPIGSDHQPWLVTADASGSFITAWHVCEDDCVGEMLKATADGQNYPYLHADVLFRDAAVGDYRSNPTSGNNWSTLANWERYDGANWTTPTALQGYPGQFTGTGAVTIRTNHSITLDITPANAIGSLTVGEGNNNQSTLTMNSNLIVTGDVFILNPSNSNTSQVNVGANSLTVNGNLSITGAAGNKIGLLAISTGIVTVEGNISVTSSSFARIVFSGNGRIKIAGTFGLGASSTFTPGTGTIEYNGSGAQSIAATTYFNLETSNGGTKNLSSGGTAINGTFTIGSYTTVDVLGIQPTIASGGSVAVNGTLDFSNSSGFITSTSGTISIASNGLIKTADDGGLGPSSSASLQGTWTTTSLSTNGTVEYYRTSAQTVTDRDYKNLTITNVGMKTWNLVSIRQVAGNLRINSGSGLTLSGTNSLDVLGDWVNDGTFSAGSIPVNMSGNGPQDIGGSSSTTFSSLNVLNSAFKTLSNNITVSTGLGLGSTNINTVGNVVTANSISRSTGYINGNLSKTFNNSNTSRSFEIGDGTRYAPIDLSFSSINTGSFFTINAFTLGANHPNINTSTIDQVNNVNRYWSVGKIGPTTFSTYDIVLHFDAADVDAGANTSNFIVGKYDGSWLYPTVGTKTATSTQATGLTSFSTFAVGAACADPTINAQPIGRTKCSGDSAHLSITATGPGTVTYQWYKVGTPDVALANGGAISGATSAELVINPLSTSDAGSYYVIVSRACGSATTSATVSIIVNIAPSITLQPTNQTITYGNTAVFTVTATGTAPLTYQWQEDVGGDGGFNNISDGGVYSGTSTATLTLTKAGVSMSTNKYRCIVTGVCSPAATSDGAATLTINQKPLTVTAVTDTKTYDGTIGSSASPTVGTLISGDAVDAAPTQVYDNKNYGTTHVLTASGLTIKDGSSADMTGNYTITYAPSPATGVINKAAVTVTAVTDAKTYDGTTSSSASPTVGTLISGDAVDAAPTQVYDNKNYGTTHVLTASGLTIKDGSSADMTGNYTITYAPSAATGVINKAAVTVTAVTDAKTYDGTTSSSASPTVGTLISGDVVNTAPTQVYDNKNYGTTHILTASGLTIKDGSNADMTGNYTITYAPSPATGVINKAAVTVTAVTDTKTYDGTTGSSASPTVGTLISGDVVNAAPTQVYDNKTYGTTHVLTASGLTIKDGSSADMTGNYTITYAPSAATGVINKAAVTVTAVTDTKTYDGTTSSSASPTVGVLATGDVVNTAPTQVYDNKNYGLTHVLTASGLTIKDGSNADMTGNYTITYAPSPATGVINKAAVTVTAVTDTKTYDGTTGSSASPTVGTLISGDVLNAAPTQVYDNKNYGITHILTASGLTIKDGSSAEMTGNYTITYAPSPATGVINKAAVTVTAVTDTKTYDGTTGSSASPTVGTLISGDVLNAAPTQVYDNKNYGTTHVLTASGLTIKDGSSADMTGNYTITYTPSPATGVINKAAVTVTAVTDTKTYDGTTGSSASPTVGTLISGDVVNAAPTQVYDNKNYGTTHVLTASGLTIKDGSNADMTGNYTITYAPSPATGVINKAAVTVTAVTDAKTYDGTTSSSASPTVGTLISGDVVNTAPTQVYDNKNYGITHILTASGLTIKDGSSADMTGNYTITYAPSPATGVINKAAVTVTAVTDTKTYDGTTGSSASPTVGTLISGDVLNAAPTQVYDNKNYGLTHVLTASGLTIKDGSNADMTGNYTITYTPSPATGVINKAAVTVTAVTDTKTYDGTTGSSASPTVGTLISGDVVNAAPTQVYDNKNYGTTHVLTASGLTIKDGSSADMTGNYTITYTPSPATGVINKAAVTVTAVTDTKTYDGTTGSSASPTVGTLISGDVVNAAPTQVYDNKNYGTTHVLTASGLTIKDGSSADMTGNYTITYAPSPATGVINKAAVTVTAVTDAKTYDGTTSSSASPTVGTLISGDVLNAAPTQVYDNKNYGTTHVLTASGLTIKDGSSADMTGNYTITYAPSPATGVINKAAVTVTAVTDTKTYDGTTGSSASPTVGTLISGDVLNAAPTQVYDNKNYGITHILTASGLTIKDGSSADMTGNYTITYAPSPATGVINKAAVTVTAVTDMKTYDGTTGSSASPTVGTLISGDAVDAAPTQVYDNKNYGLTHILTASGLTIKDGSSADMTGNYMITYAPSPATGVINKAAVTVTAVTDTKTYDGTTSSSASPTVGVLATGDVVNTAPTQVYDNKNYGTTHVLTASGLTIKDGSNADMTGNYTITYAPSPATGVINKAAVTVTAVTDTKTYDGTTGSSASSTVGTLISGDVVNAAPTQVYDNKNYGTTHVLTASGLTIKDGSSADMTGNYTITYAPSPATGVINKAAVTVTAITDAKTYDGTTGSSASPTVGTLISGDVLNAAPTQVYDNKNYGTTHVLTASGLTIKDGSNADMTGNYTITYAPSPATGVINKKGVTITAVTDTKTYDGTTSSSASPTVGTLISGDVVNIAPTQVYDNKNYGTTHVLTASGLTIKDGSSADMTGNYTITYAPSPATGVINKAAVTVTAVTDTKTYDGTTSSSASPTVGVLATGDVVNTAPTQVYDNKNYGTTHVLTASGLTIKDGSSADMTGNYTITYAPSPATGVINKAAVTVTAVTDTKTYDGTTGSSASPTVGTLISGDVVNAAPTQVYDNKNYGTTHVLTASGLTIKDGSSADMTGNYTITYAPSPATGVINKAAVTVTAVTDAKTYDGTTSSSASPTVGTLISGDVVNAAPAQVYDNRNYGLTHVLTASGLTIKDALNANMTGNYTITYAPSPATGVINKRALVVAAVTSTKIYDGNTSSPSSPSVPALQTGDAIGTAPTQTYDNEFVGTNKTLTASGLIINDGNGGNNYTVSYTQNFTGVITLATSTTTLITSAGVVRYMDNLTMTATIKPLNTGSPLTGNVQFSIGGVNYGLPVDVVPIPGDPEGKVQATLIKQVTNLPINSYNVLAVFTSTNSNYSGSTSNTKALQVKQRNASPYGANQEFYTGDIFAWTTGQSSSTATVKLATVIKDNNSPTGDLRSAKVTFYLVSGTSMTPISGAQNLPVGLVDINDGSVGAASAIVQLNIGSNNAQDFQIAVGISGAYYNYSSAPEAQAILTISKPVPGGYMVCGGKTLNTNSSGYIRGHSTMNTDFESDIVYTKSGTNPKGKAKVLVRSYYKIDGTLDSKLHTYIITSNAIASLNVTGITSTAPATATFSAKANLVEQLDDLSIVSIEGGAVFDMVVTQNQCDQRAAITLYRKAGGIWFSNNWVINKTEPRALIAGQASVTGGGSCTSPYTTSRTPGGLQSTTETEQQPIIVTELKAKAFPNPSETYFNLSVESGNAKDEVQLLVYNVKGQLVHQAKGTANRNYKFGEGWISGMYFVQVRQGKELKTLQVMKQ